MRKKRGVVVEQVFEKRIVTRPIAAEDIDDAVFKCLGNGATYHVTADDLQNCVVGAENYTIPISFVDVPCHGCGGHHRFYRDGREFHFSPPNEINTINVRPGGDLVLSFDPRSRPQEAVALLARQMEQLLKTKTYKADRVLPIEISFSTTPTTGVVAAVAIYLASVIPCQIAMEDVGGIDVGKSVFRIIKS